MTIKLSELQKKTKRQFYKERDFAVLSFDVQKFRHFHNKWTLLGLYDIPLPEDDNIVMATICKMAYHSKAAKAADREKAKKWLKERGFSTKLD